ncbi:MAG: dTDP-4-dehydrorhamnose reductase [Armatimonadota bacterium]
MLVTGALGMLGRIVVKDLKKVGHEPIATDCADGCIIMDICDEKSVFDTFDKYSPEMVIHCAAMTNVDGCEQDPDSAYKINALGSMIVACACAKYNATMAYVSTDYVFDGNKGTPYTEYDETNPTSHYGASKLAGERAVIEVCPKHFVVRTSWLFAPHGKNFAITMMNASEKTKELKVVCDQFGSPTYAKDLSSFLVGLVGFPLYGIYHYTNSGMCSWHEFASTIFEKAGKTDVVVHPIKTEDWPTPTKRPEYSVLRHYKMELLGKDDARDWKEAVTEFVKEWTTAKQ